MHVERILPDSAHFAEIKPALDSSFIKVLLPTLLTGKLIHSQGTETPTKACHTSSATYCWCRGEEVGQMVACDNPQCTIGGFIFTALV